MPTDPYPAEKSYTTGDGKHVWTTNSTSPEAKIPKGQFIPGDFTPPKDNTHHTDPVAPYSGGND